MKLSNYVWLENAYSRLKNWSLGVFHPQNGKQYQRNPQKPKDTSAGRNGSRGALITSVSSIVPEKSRGNKMCDEEELEEELRHVFGRFGITVTWCHRDMVVCKSFDIYMFIPSRTARWCQYLINSAFLSFFWGCQTWSVIAVLKTPSGSIS